MIVILGGGLAGMATAWFLGDRPHVVLEAEQVPGGLCRTRVVNGFHFDYTGHLLHLRDARMVALVEEFLPGALETIARDARIRTRGVTLPFPFQANLHGLPKEIVAACIVGVAEAARGEVPADPATSFRDWSLAVLGAGISEAFMFPYNAKLFRRDPADMTADWVSWAVPRPSLREVVHGALGIVNVGLGYNATFRYPRAGGIGALPEAFARRMTSLRAGSRVVRVDLARREVELAGGETLRWDRLVSTLPLPDFLRLVTGGRTGLAQEAARLDWTVVGCLNLGIDRPGVGAGAHWIYFPDPDVPFYRAGFPTNMTAGCAPPGTSSVYVEFGLKRGESPDPVAVEADVLAVLRREGILDGRERVVARDWTLIDPGYVIFDRARRDVLARVVPELEACGVRLIGRYGAWTYSYMERAMLDGLEAAEALSRGA
jgi:protoporphyrinogen oxidase